MGGLLTRIWSQRSWTAHSLLLLWCSLLLIAAVLLIRRLSGSFTLSIPSAVTVGGMIAGLAVAALIAISLGERWQSFLTRPQRFIAGLTLLSPGILITLALLPVVTIGSVLLVLCGLLIGSAGLMLALESTESQCVVQSSNEWPNELAVNRIEVERDLTDTDNRWTRHTDADGNDRLEGIASVNFAAGARQASWHMPLHPAMPALPHVECETLDAADVRLKVALVMPYGIRIDARRTQPTDVSQTVTFGFAIVAAAAQQDVA